MMDPAGTPEPVVIRVEGMFDPMAASALRARLAQARPQRPIVLDFAHAREVSDLGLAVLAHGLASDGSSVRFRGLSQHHERMLRYLGLDGSLLHRATDDAEGWDGEGDA